MYREDTLNASESIIISFTMFLQLMTMCQINLDNTMYGLKKSLKCDLKSKNLCQKQDPRVQYSSTSGSWPC